MALFTELGLDAQILKGISELGFETPTPIQEKAIPFLLDTDRDLIALAQTGTGKTAAFGLPILHAADVRVSTPQALILAPTRELCLQIAADMERYSKYVSGFGVAAIYGGAPIDKQLRQLAKGAHVVVATPGRMLDVIHRRKVDFSKIKTVVLDEADEMLNMGFKEELNAILAETPKEKRTLLFSATMPREVASIAKNYMTDPFEITSGTKNEGASTVTHKYFMVHARDRYMALKRIADSNPNIYGIVFCRTRTECKDVADQLIQDGYSADALHGDLSQAQRDYVMQKFRTKTLQMLVATDVAARGLDVNDLTHVINYNLPDDVEIYTHRSGRTGRAGKTGESLAIINMKEKGRIRMIEKIIKKQFEHALVPTGQEICGKQLVHMIERMKNVVVNEEQIAPFMDDVLERFAAMDKEELLKHFLSVEFNRFLDYYSKAKDINADNSRSSRDDYERPERGERGERSERGERPERRKREEGGNKGVGGARDEGFSRFFMNVGRKDGIMPKNIIGLINDATGDKSIEIGAIDIMGTFSFFDVETASASKVAGSFVNIDYQGREVRVELAAEGDGAGEEVSRPRRSSGGGERSSGGGERRSFGGERSGGYNSDRSSGGDRGGSNRGGGENRGGGDRDRSFGGDRGSSRPSRPSGGSDRGGDRGGYNRGGGSGDRDRSFGGDRPKKRY